MVIALTLHMDCLLEYFLLLLFLQEGLIILEQHVLVLMVLRLNLHDVLVEYVLFGHLKARALLSVDSLLSGQD